MTSETPASRDVARLMDETLRKSGFDLDALRGSALYEDFRACVDV